MRHLAKILHGLHRLHFLFHYQEPVHIVYLATAAGLFHDYHAVAAGVAAGYATIVVIVERTSR